MKKDTLYYIGCLTLILVGFIGLVFWIGSENAKIERDNQEFTARWGMCVSEFIPQEKDEEDFDGYLERYKGHMVECVSK